MTAVHVNWFIENLESAHEESTTRTGQPLSPIEISLTAVLAQSAFHRGPEPGKIPIAQVDAAERAGFSRRSVHAVYQRLCEAGILRSLDGKRYALGPWWERMDFEHKFLRYQEVRGGLRETEPSTPRKRKAAEEPEAELDALAVWEFEAPGGMDTSGWSVWLRDALHTEGFRAEIVYGRTDSILHVYTNADPIPAIVRERCVRSGWQWKLIRAMQASAGE